MFANYGILLALCILFIFTQTWADVDTSQSLGFSDTRSYIAIANCPIFEVCDIGTLYPNHHLERWLPNVLAGALANVLGIGLHQSYLTLVWIVLFASVLMCISVSESHENSIILISTIIFFPYGFRSFFFAPAMIADAVFLMATVAITLSISHSNIKLLFLSCILGSFSRQTSIIFVPMILTAIYKGKLSVEVGLFGCLLIITLIFGNHYAARELFGVEPASTIAHAFGLFNWIKAGASWGESAAFFSRAVFFLLLLSPALMLKYNKKNIHLAAILFSLLAIQPLLAGPEITGGNILRLLAYGVPFIYLALPQSQVDINQNLFYYIMALWVLSLHHHYTGLFSQPIYFAAVMIIVAMSYMVFKLDASSIR